MKNDKLKAAIDVRLSALHGTPESRERIMRCVKEDRIVKRKLSYSAILVAVMVILMASVALASGLLDSVFELMKNRYSVENVDYEAVQQAAKKDVFSQEVELPGADEPMLVNIKESYYDGESMMLGFSYTVPHRPASFDFGPEHPFFSQLEPMGNVVLESKDVQVQTEAGYQLDLKDVLTEAEYQRYQDELKKNGKVGIVYYDTYLSDGVYGENGEQFTCGTDDRDQLPDGTQWRMLASGSTLPESMRNRDEIGIEFKVVQHPAYYYEDETCKYWKMSFDERVVVPLTTRIKRSEANAVRYQTDAQMAEYSVNVDAVAAPAYVKATFKLDVPEEWAKVAESDVSFTEGKSPVDYVCDFILVGHGTEIDGEIIEARTNYSSLDLSEMSGTYPPLYEGEDKMIFRPVYANSGPRPEEDIVIDIKP